MKVFYRYVLKSAWQTIWKLKFLWFFGAFAALTANGEEYDIIIRNFDTVKNIEEKLQSLKSALNEGIISTAWQNLINYFTNNVFSSLLIIFAALLIVIAFIYLITVSQTAIIKATARFRKNELFVFFDGFVVGTKYFWPILVLNLFAKIIIYGTLVVFGVPLTLIYISSDNFFWLATFSLIAFLALIPLNIFISFIVKYASIYIILKDFQVRPAIKSALKLFYKNWLITLENAFLLYAINFIITFFLVGSLTFAGLPFTATGYLVFLGIVVFIGAIIASFQFSAWTYIFIEISENRGVAKLIRLFKREKEAVK